MPRVGQAAGRAACDLSALCRARSSAGSILRCEPRCCVASTPTAGRAPTTGRRRGRAAAGGRSSAGRAKPAVAADAICRRLLERAAAGRDLTERDIVTLFRARGDEFSAVTAAADALRADVCGDTVSLRGHAQHQLHQHLLLSLPVLRVLQRQDQREPARAPLRSFGLDEIGARVREAWARGATEVCMQGGIHPVLHRRRPISTSAVR